METATFGAKKTKYIIAILLFAMLTSFVVSNSLLPWIREHHLGAAEKYRLLAYRSAMDGAVNESESFYRAALMEAQKLGDPEMVKDISDELKDLEKLKSDRTSKLQLSNDPDTYQIWLWRSQIDDRACAARNRKYMKRWMPIFTIAFQQEQALAVNDPTRLIELGDWQLNLLHLPYAELLYRKANTLAHRENAPIMEVQILDRMAHVAYASQNYDEAIKKLSSCLEVAKKLPSQKHMVPILVAHKAQVYAEIKQPERGINLCEQALKTPEVSHAPLLKWYLHVLRGQCLSLTGKHNQAIACLKQCELDAEIFPSGSDARPRVCRAIAEALVEAERLEDAESYFYKLVDLTSKVVPESAIDYEYKLLDEAALYSELKKYRQEMFLLDLVLHSREARIGKNGKGLNRILSIQRRACLTAGDFQKAQEIQLRIQSLNSN